MIEADLSVIFSYWRGYGQRVMRAVRQVRAIGEWTTREVFTTTGTTPSRASTESTRGSLGRRLISVPIKNNKKFINKT